MASFEITSITSPGAGQVYTAGDLIPVRYFYENAPESNYEVYIGLTRIVDGVDQSPSIQPIDPAQFITGQYNYVSSTKALPGSYYIGIQLMDYNTMSLSEVFKSGVFTLVVE